MKRWRSKWLPWIMKNAQAIHPSIHYQGWLYLN
jgi:hypothetical protein